MSERDIPHSDFCVATLPTHPAFTVFRTCEEEFSFIKARYDRVPEGNDQQIFIQKEYGFLADAFAVLPPFELEVDDIVAIGYGIQSLSLYEQYAIAKMICATYCIPRVSNSVWKTLPRYFIETFSFPEGTGYDMRGLKIIGRRLKELDKNVDLLLPPILSPEDIIRLAREDAIGDPYAHNKLEKLFCGIESTSDPFLGEIHERFSTALMSLSGACYVAIDEIRGHHWNVVDTQE